MTPLGHSGAALVTAFGLAYLFPNLDRDGVLIATTLGGVSPDLDIIYYHFKTKTRFLDKDMGDHRFQASHTPIFMISIGIASAILLNIFSLTNLIPYVCFFVIGTFIHLLTDTLFFPEGIVFFYPFSKKNYSFFLVKTPSFWAKKNITRVPGWYINYLLSPVFWIFEVTPTIIAVLVYFLT